MLQPDLISAVNAGIDWPKPATAPPTDPSIHLWILSSARGMYQQLMLPADFAPPPCTLLFLDDGGENKTARSCTLFGPLSTDYLILNNGTR